MKAKNSILSDATVNEKLPEIENKINGKLSVNLAKDTGNKVEDIIELASDPGQLRKAFFKEKNPVQLSVESIITYPSQMLKFRITLHLGLSVDEPVVLLMPRSFLKDPGKWVNKNLLEFPKMSEDFINYIVQIFEGLLPQLEENAVELFEDKTMTETVREICEFVKKNDTALKNDLTGSSHYMVEELPDEHEGKVVYYCIKGKDAFDEMLRGIDSNYKRKDIVTACDCWRGGSLLRKNSGHMDYKMHKADSARWICIRHDDLIMQERGDRIGD